MAISADVDNSDGNVSTLNATVSGNATYGGISLRIVGDSPYGGSTNLTDNAANYNSIYFSATQDINIDGNQTFDAAGGDIQLFAGRDVNWTSGGWTLATTGSAVVSAARDVNVSSNNSIMTRVTATAWR